MNRFFLHSMGIFLVLATQTRAAPLRTTERELPSPRSVPEVYPDLSKKAWWLFAGLDFGGISYSSLDPAFVGTRSGLSVGGRVRVSRYFSDFVVDGGLGWKYISASGTDPALLSRPETQVKINSRVPHLDLSVRYRISDRFQVGPQFEFWLGTDNGLNEDNLSTATNYGKFIGVEAVYEWDRHRKHRVGGRVLTSLGVPGRTVLQYIAFYQISFDLFGERAESIQNKSYEQVSPSDLEKAESLTPREPIPMAPQSAADGASDQDLGYAEPAPDVMSTPAPPEENIEPGATPVPTAGAAVPAANQKPIPAKKLVLTLGMNDLPFGSTEAKLPLAHQARIRNIGKYLSKNQSLWKRVEVSAHTDERGDDRKNKKISLKRAKLIRTLLMEGGVPAKRITAAGLGESKPLDRRHNEKAWSRNQRVELGFTSVKDSNLIKRALEQ